MTEDNEKVGLQLLLAFEGEESPNIAIQNDNKDSGPVLDMFERRMRGSTVEYINAIENEIKTAEIQQSKEHSPLVFEDLPPSETTTKSEETPTKPTEVKHWAGFLSQTQGKTKHYRHELDKWKELEQEQFEEQQSTIDALTESLEIPNDTADIYSKRRSLQYNQKGLDNFADKKDNLEIFFQEFDKQIEENRKQLGKEVTEMQRKLEQHQAKIKDRLSRHITPVKTDGKGGNRMSIALPRNTAPVSIHGIDPVFSNGYLETASSMTPPGPAGPLLSPRGRKNSVPNDPSPLQPAPINEDLSESNNNSEDEFFSMSSGDEDEVFAPIDSPKNPNDELMFDMDMNKNKGISHSRSMPNLVGSA